MESFISYSSENIEQAKAVVDAIRKKGYEVWFAPEHVKAGKNFAQEITSVIQKCDKLILVFSQSSNKSVHIQRELELAIKYNKQILPLRIEDVFPSESMEYFLSTVQWFDLCRDFQSSLESFVNEYYPQKFSNNTIKSVEQMAKKHFEQMGYTIKEQNYTYYALQNSSFTVKKDKLQFVLIPVFRENATVAYFKALEAELFWEYRDAIWTKEFHKLLMQKLQIDPEKFASGEIDYKLKSQVVEMFRKTSYMDKKKYSQNINVLFYLYVKNPPKYSKLNYDVPLQNEKNYKDGEELSHLFMNLAFYPNWWAAGKDNLDSIGKDERYRGFLQSYKQIQSQLSIQSEFKAKNKHYESYNGEVAETICKIFLKKCDLLVHEFGAENSFGNTFAFLNNLKSKDSKTLQNLVRFMTSPDLLVMSLDGENNVMETMFVDVKYRVFENYEMFLESLKNGELHKQAKKYNHNWNDVYLFMFIYFEEDEALEIYFESTQEIIQNKNVEPKPLHKKHVALFSTNEIQDLYKLANKIWV